MVILMYPKGHYSVIFHVEQGEGGGPTFQKGMPKIIQSTIPSPAQCLVSHRFAEATEIVLREV